VEKLPEENVFKEDLVESPKENLKLVESYKILKQNNEGMYLLPNYCHYFRYCTNMTAPSPLYTISMLVLCSEIFVEIV
jgi:hypothetical protein